MESSAVHKLARELGVERRRNARANYPPRTSAGLPTIGFDGYPMRAYDISAGGCALHDPGEVLGKDIGIEVRLTVHFHDRVDEVQCRLVGRVDHRRHIQFLDLDPTQAARITRQIAPGVCGSSLKMSFKAESSAPKLLAREIWSSLAGDGLTLDLEGPRLAQATIGEREFIVPRDAWPTAGGKRPLSEAELHDLILFIANVRHPSPALAALLVELEDLSLEVSR